VIEGLPFSGRVSTEGSIHFDGPWDILQRAAPEVRQRIDLRHGLTATRLHHQGGRVRGVDLSGGAESVSLGASTVLLAAGAVGVPLLLHRSGIRSEALGRGVSFHSLLLGQVVLDGALCAAAADEDIRPRLWIPPTDSTPWHVQVLRDTCPLPSPESVDNPHRLLEFQAFLPMEFREENALVIDDNGRAAFRFSFSERDREDMRAMDADVRRLAERLGPWRRGCEPTWMPDGNGHLVGTCRMDRSGWDGVTDRVGKVHGFDNLYLATVGMFPAPVSVNPTLTGMALAVETCRAIATPT
jgi:choline dehydrogenase-like flavoprotein